MQVACGECSFTWQGPFLEQSQFLHSLGQHLYMNSVLSTRGVSISDGNDDDGSAYSYMDIDRFIQY